MDSRTSRPVGRTGKFCGVDEVLVGRREDGMSERVMAWTPWKVPARIRRSLLPSFARPVWNSRLYIRPPALLTMRRAKTVLGWGVSYVLNWNSVPLHY